MTPTIKINKRPSLNDRLPHGRPRNAEYDNFALAVGAWFDDGKGTGEISVGPFWKPKELVRFRMGFPRSRAFEGLSEKVRRSLRSRLSADRKTIYYYLNLNKEAK